MEGLIPFVYRAILQYRTGVDVGTAMYYAGAGGGFNSEPSPSRGGAYVRLSSGDSGRFRQHDTMPSFVRSAPSPSNSGNVQSPLRRSASRSRKA